jgi:hypothetical protein
MKTWHIIINNTKLTQIFILYFYKQDRLIFDHSANVKVNLEYRRKVLVPNQVVLKWLKVRAEDKLQLYPREH